jgi:hypothetical protein
VALQVSALSIIACADLIAYNGESDSDYFGESDMMRHVILAVALVSAGSAFAQQNSTFIQNPGVNAAPPAPTYVPSPQPNSPVYSSQPPIPYIFLGYPQIAACSRIPTSLTCSW